MTLLRTLSAKKLDNNNIIGTAKWLKKKNMTALSDAQPKLDWNMTGRCSQKHLKYMIKEKIPKCKIQIPKVV